MTTNGDGSTLAVAHEIGRPFRVVDHWARRGYLRPAVAGGGSGSRRRWPVLERRVAALMVRLIDAGFTPAAAAAIARAAVGIHEVAPDAPALIDAGAGIVLVIRPLEVTP